MGAEIFWVKIRNNTLQLVNGLLDQNTTSNLASFCLSPLVAFPQVRDRNRASDAAYRSHLSMPAAISTLAPDSLEKREHPSLQVFSMTTVSKPRTR